MWRSALRQRRRRRRARIHLPRPTRVSPPLRTKQIAIGSPPCCGSGRQVHELSLQRGAYMNASALLLRPSSHYTTKAGASASSPPCFHVANLDGMKGTAVKPGTGPGAGLHAKVERTALGRAARRPRPRRMRAVLRLHPRLVAQRRRGILPAQRLARAALLLHGRRAATGVQPGARVSARAAAALAGLGGRLRGHGRCRPGPRVRIDGPQRGRAQAQGAAAAGGAPGLRPRAGRSPAGPGTIRPGARNAVHLRQRPCRRLPAPNQSSRLSLSKLGAGVCAGCR